MIGYIKTNKPNKLQKVKRHLDSLGFKLDILTLSDEPNTIEIYTNFNNYDIWRRVEGEDMSGFTKLKIKEVLGTATIDEVKELILYATR